MSYNNEITNENAVVEKKGFLLPNMFEGEFSKEDLDDDMEGLQLSFQRVKIPAGGTVLFEIPGDNPEEPEYAKTIEGIILHTHLTSAYWPVGSEFDDNATPLCSSVDGKVGYGTPGGACAACPLNQYETATDSNGRPSKGKACKNMRNLYILREGEIMPIQLTLPPTSLTPYSDFAGPCFVQRRRPCYASVVQVGLKKVEGAANTYSVATFKKLRDLEGEELQRVMEFAGGFKAQIKGILQLRANDAMTRSEADSLYDEAPYQLSGDTAAALPKAGVINGDNDELPL